MSIVLRPADEFSSGEPGFYADVPAEIYHALDAFSNSRGNKFNISPAACRDYIDNPPETKTFDLGRARHCALFEPMIFATDYATAGQCEGIKKDGARCTSGGSVRVANKWYCGTHVKSIDGERDDVLFMSQDEYDKTLRMGAVAQGHTAFQKLLSLPGAFEVSVLFEHPVTEILCKCRIDFLSFDPLLIVDYKTTKDLAYEFGLSRDYVRTKPNQSFKTLVSWALYKYGYFRQGAMYPMACHALGHKLDDFVIFAQDTPAPFQAICARIKHDAFVAGRSQLDEMILNYSECLKSGNWPGYVDDEILNLDLPDQAYSYIYDRELDN